MPSATLNDCTQLDATLLERVNYFPRQLLTADDMIADQQYFIAKMRRHNRYLHGWGVVCGLGITIAPTAASPWMVQISPGYALGPYGDEIYVPNPVNLDLAQCGPGASTDPCDPGSLMMTGTAKTGSIIYIAIRYEECFARPVTVLPGGCGCNDTNCEPSRISDTFEIQCLADLPPGNTPGQGPSMCDYITGRLLPQCLPCPTDPWVVLAQVTLPSLLGQTLPQTNINTVIRRQIFSTAVIQEQVRLCCCAGRDQAPVRVISITPANGSVFTAGIAIPPAILISFDKHLVAATANKDTISVLFIPPAGAGGAAKVLDGTVTYDDATMTAKFTPNSPFTAPGIYQTTVVGSGPSFITDSDNLALDGNADGSPGGNFIAQFTVEVPTQPTPTPTVAATPTPTPAPTQAPAPLVVGLQGKVVNIRAGNQAIETGELLVVFSNGVAGQKSIVDVNVMLTLNIGASSAADTAVWSDASGVTNATKAGNVYTFSNVTVIAPGPGNTAKVKVANVKVNTTGIRQAQDVFATVSFVTTGGPAVPAPVPPSVLVAKVTAG